jgi:hypothetical protein
MGRKKIFRRMADELRGRRAEKTSDGGMPGSVSDFAGLWKRARTGLHARFRPNGHSKRDGGANEKKGECQY